MHQKFVKIKFLFTKKTHISIYCSKIIKEKCFKIWFIIEFNSLLWLKQKKKNLDFNENRIVWHNFFKKDILLTMQTFLFDLI